MEAFMFTPDDFFVNTFIGARQKRNELSNKIISISLTERDDEDVPIYSFVEPEVWFNSKEGHQVFNLKSVKKLYHLYKEVLVAVKQLNPELKSKQKLKLKSHPCIIEKEKITTNV